MPTDANQRQTPVSDHVQRFWELLEREKVRIVVDIHRPESFGGLGHWDAATFSDEVAKALVAELDENEGHMFRAMDIAKSAEAKAERMQVEVRKAFRAGFLMASCAPSNKQETAELVEDEQKSWEDWIESQ